MTNLIKELNNSLKPKDEIGTIIEAAMSPTHLDDDQVEVLVDYMKEIIDGAHKRGNDLAPAEAAGLALEDVAGFENAPRKVLSATVNRLVSMYQKKHGAQF